MVRSVAIASCLLLTSCAAALLDGVAIESLAARGAIGGLAAEGAAGAAAADAITASRLIIAPEVASASELGALGEGGASLFIDSSGIIRAGSQTAQFEGANIVANGRLVATLQEGVVYRDGVTAAGRFRSLLPADSVRLDFTNGVSATNTRPMLVDVLKFENGRYLVRLATGDEAWVLPTGLSLAILSLAPQDHCEPDRGPGVMVRTSGEPLVFDRCSQQYGNLVFSTTEGDVAADPEEVRAISYDPSEIRFAESAMTPAGAG